jgi:hypothetical protein
MDSLCQFTLRQKPDAWHFRAYFSRQAVPITFSIQSGYLVANQLRAGGLTVNRFRAKVCPGSHKVRKKTARATGRRKRQQFHQIHPNLSDSKARRQIRMKFRRKR